MKNDNVDEVFKLEIVTDNPLFEGFGMSTSPSVLGRRNLREDISPGFGADENTRVWRVPRLAKLWQPPKVVGRVQAYQDFPGLGMTLPAFSQRACAALTDFLLPNGELLPLKSAQGEYYFYNITTVIDALDVNKSDCTFWCDPPTTAVDIDFFVFKKNMLKGASIFRIVEMPVFTLVTSSFVNRVYEAGLNGFHFIKIWPFPKGVNWRKESNRKEKMKRAATRSLKQNTVVVILPLTAAKPNASEKKKIKLLENDLDAQLAISHLAAPFFGQYEGSDNVDKEFRLFISCPDANKLLEKLSPWLNTLNWRRTVYVMKRFGEMHDESAAEEIIELPH